MNEKIRLITPPYGELSSNQPRDHFAWIDLIRFLAALMVLVCHYRGAFFVEYGLLPESQQTPLMFFFYSVTRLGHEAVLVFFVLSGFLVGGRAIERISKNQFRPKDYTIDRAVRILLPLMSSLLFALIVRLVIRENPRFDVLLGNLFSLQGIACAPYSEPFWSLSYEVWFYILMFAIGYCSVHRGRNKMLLGLFLLLICFLVFTKLNVTYLFVWILGAFSFLSVRKRSKKILFLSFGFILILMGLLQITSSTNIAIPFAEKIDRSIIELLFGFIVSLFVMEVVQFPPRRRVGMVFDRWGTKLAAFSYTLYLIHFPLFRLLTFLGAPKCTSVNVYSVCLFCCWLIIALGFSYLVFLVFERNTPTVKRWIKSRI